MSGCSSVTRAFLGWVSSFEEVELPGMVENQLDAFFSFVGEIGVNKGLDNAGLCGLGVLFKSVFPVTDYANKAQLEFVDYRLEEPKYDENECRNRATTYFVVLRVTFRLIIWSYDNSTQEREIKSIKEQSVFMGEIPMMTDRGTFLVNGIEHVVVSQMHRSPGVFFSHDEGKSHSSGKLLYSVRVIPYRGSWLDFEFDGRDLLYCRIDRKRKILCTTFLQACGINRGDIVKKFYNSFKCVKHGEKWSAEVEDISIFCDFKFPFDLISFDTGEVVVKSGVRINKRVISKLQSNAVKSFLFDEDKILDCYCGKAIILPTEDCVIVEIGERYTREHLVRLETLCISEIELLAVDNNAVNSYILDSLAADRNYTQESALLEIYRIIRPGETASSVIAKSVFSGLFFDEERYDLSDVGRMKINARLGWSDDGSSNVLSNDDVVAIISELISVKDGYASVDDIDHLGNRRVRCVGELLENQFRIGLVRVVKAAVERMSSSDLECVMPHDLINPKLLMSGIREFFSVSQLSQFMDQTNPLSEITHKRRLSALGPGGLTRERAGFEVRDVHFTHYGRICPIETPEGQNIGLINSLAIYARINKYGFIEAPYRKVENGILTGRVDYLSAIEEGRYNIAQSNAKIDQYNKLVDELVYCRKNGDFAMVGPNDVDYIDVSPKQLVSVAASLIPFLENDDANRALMGSNMQRQAVPILKPEAPLVGTGMEKIVARGSNAVVVAKRSGIVRWVDASRIVVLPDDSKDSLDVDIYNLRKFVRSNYNTCVNQRPLVRINEYVRAGQVIADSSSTDGGELALGRNIVVAFMSWKGDNFEDSIIVSERVVQSDMFTSVHIEEFECVARDTRLGSEDITRYIPNVSEELLTRLDETGVIHIGIEVKAGDILVGKVTPKSESPMTPEERLLRAVFGEGAADVSDSSLYVPPGISGIVVDVRILSRRGVEKDERALSIDKKDVDSLNSETKAKLDIIEECVYDQIEKLLEGKRIVKVPRVVAGTGVEGSIVNKELLSKFNKREWLNIEVDDSDTNNKIGVFAKKLIEVRNYLNKNLKSSIDRLLSGVDLPHGALKVVKVYIATKHKLQPGDKMSGRHGNKGVISRVVPVEDMPYLEDGTPVDIILNPLGVPSRMNVGQILETHLGWAVYNIGKMVYKLAKDGDDGWESRVRDLLSKVFFRDKMKDDIIAMNQSELRKFALSCVNGIPVAVPIFEAPNDKKISEFLSLAGLDTSGQTYLYDGFTGIRFDRKITVGCIYMLKLHHLVDNKIHARSIGSYSLVTQQPLGGKAHFGGQRFGEMECWALQAYGAAFILQEMLTVKSDDVFGRIRLYEYTIRGESCLECGIPESFNVTVKEMRALGLKVELKEADE